MNKLDKQYTVALYSEEQKQRFTIDDDSLADWAIRKIQFAQAEHERITTLLKIQIEYLKEQIKSEDRRLERNTSFLRVSLQDYYESKPEEQLSHSKTQSKYRLVSGNLVYKHDKLSMTPVDEQLLDYMKNNKLGRFINVVEGIKWGEYKKQLEIVGDSVIDIVTGDIVQGVAIETKQGRFEVKL